MASPNQYKYTSINQELQSSPLIQELSRQNIHINSNNNNNNNNDNDSEFLHSYQSISSPLLSPSSSISRYFLAPKQKNGKLIYNQIVPVSLMMLVTSVVIFLIIFTRDYSANNQPLNQSPFVIEFNSALLDVALTSRTRLLTVHQGSITKLNFAILLLENSGAWSIAHYNGYELSNASRCVYLPFLTAAVNWCIQQNNDPHCLQMAAGPMINAFSTIHSGILVDTITGEPNQYFEQGSSQYESWVEGREYIEDFLDSYGLLGNQTILSKIYPTNSGPIATGSEERALEEFGPNTMNPYYAAMLMLFVTQGGIVSTGQPYMTDLLSVQTFTQQTSLGFGVPPGSVMHSILGTDSTQDDVNEVAHIELPNGRQLIIAAFSDAYQNYGNPPYQSSMLGMFASDLIYNMNLTQGNPICIVMTTNSSACQLVGPWVQSTAIQAYDKTYMYAEVGQLPEAMITWSIPINQSGLYEICIWFPAAANQTSAASYIVNTGDQTGLSYRFPINQIHYGARWILLDSFYFVEGTSPTVAISNNGDPSLGAVVAADAIKLTMWPTTNNIPGLGADMISEANDY